MRSLHLHSSVVPTYTQEGLLNHDVIMYQVTLLYKIGQALTAQNLKQVATLELWHIYILFQRKITRDQSSSQAKIFEDIVKGFITIKALRSDKKSQDHSTDVKGLASHLEVLQERTSVYGCLSTLIVPTYYCCRGLVQNAPLLFHPEQLIKLLINDMFRVPLCQHLKGIGKV